MQPQQHLRIFLSSPGDVSEERDIARELIDRELSKGPFIRGRVTFDPVSWDDPYASATMPAHLSPQDAINQGILPKPSACDVVIVILWGRFGTPLPKVHVNSDGAPFQSGTEWEYEDALKAAKANGKPTIFLYRRTQTPLIEINDPEFDAKRAQYQKVEAFFDRLQDDNGALIGSYHHYSDPDDFRRLLRQHLESVVSIALGQGFSQELGVTKAAVATMLAILKEQDVPPEQLEDKLKDIAKRHLELAEKLHAFTKSNDEPGIVRQREQAVEAIERGDYAQANGLLAEAIAIDRHAIDEHQEELDRRKLSAAATISQLGDLERIRLNYRAAAVLYDEAADLVPREENKTHLAYLEKHASVLRAQGQEFGENAALVEAVEAYQAVLKGTSRERAPLDWARAQLNLGIALRNLGRRKSDTESFGRAVKAFQRTLEISTRKNAPIDWAITQLHLGIAFQRIGERESATEHLEKAVQAYRHALEETSRKRMPLDWATIQDDLGTALRSLGGRQKAKERLEEAITAFESALEERTRERVPLEWARTQQNFAVALMLLGEREKSTEKLEKAATAYREALEERTRKRVPLDWATTKCNLAVALRILGSQESGTKRLEQAIEHHKKALQEHTRERAPIQWAWGQHHLGLAYCALAEKTSDEATFLQGLDAIKSALSAFEEAQNAYAIEITMKSLEDAEIRLKNLGGDSFPT